MLPLSPSLAPVPKSRPIDSGLILAERRFDRFFDQRRNIRPEMAVETGNLLFLSGMLPAIGHEPKFVGRLGKELDANAGREAVRIAALNVLSAARQKLGSLDKVTRVVRLCVYLATDGDFFDQPKVADAASELFRDVFGERQNVSPYGVRRGKSSSGHARGG